MYYVARADAPLWRDRLIDSGDLGYLRSWAQREAVSRRTVLIVSEDDSPGFTYRKVNATYNAQGREV